MVHKSILDHQEQNDVIFRNNYIKSIEEQIFYLKEEKKTKTSIIQSLTLLSPGFLVASQPGGG